MTDETERLKTKLRRQINQLEAKASSTPFADEAETFRLKAAELRVTFGALTTLPPPKPSSWRPPDEPPAPVVRRPRKDGRETVTFVNGVMVDTEAFHATEQRGNVTPDTFDAMGLEMDAKPRRRRDEDRETRQRKYTPFRRAKPKTMSPPLPKDAHQRGSKGRMFSQGVTRNVKPVSVGVNAGVFEGGFVTTPEDFETKLNGHPRIYLTNAEKQAEYRKRKALKLLHASKNAPDVAAD